MHGLLAYLVAHPPVLAAAASVACAAAHAFFRPLGLALARALLERGRQFDELRKDIASLRTITSVAATRPTEAIARLATAIGELRRDVFTAAAIGGASHLGAARDEALALGPAHHKEKPDDAVPAPIEHDPTDPHR